MHPDLYPGDIVEANAGLGPDDTRRRYPILVVYAGREGGRAPAGKALRPDGVVEVSIYECDLLIACGRDEDCRGSLDLAIACAEQRRAVPHVSTGQVKP